MRKLYTRPEVEVIKFASADNTNALNVSAVLGGGIGTVDNMNKVPVGKLHN